MTADATATTLHLREVMDAAYPATLLADLLACRGQTIDVDASAVVRASTLGLQVLLSAAATWKSDGVSFRLVEPSGAFGDALRTLGLSSDHFDPNSVMS